MMDIISLKNARFNCSLGIHEDEKRNPQEIEIDIDLHLNTKRAGISDEINEAIDYEEVHGAIKKVVMERHYNLIESLAECIAKEVLQKFSIKKIVVRIRKRKALAHKNVEYAAVEIIRDRK